MDLAPSQHARFFRALTERPNTTGALLRERLPRAIADELVGDPVLVEGSFLDEQMRSSYSDRLYRVELRSGSLAFVYCLVEHESSPEPRIALQLLRYQVRIWERFDRDFGGKGLLPPIYPLLVYHGRSEWTVSLRFAGLLSASDEQKLHLLDFPFGLLDVGQVDDRELSRQRELKAGLMVLKYSGRVTEHDVEEVVRRVLSELRGASDELIRLAVRYMINAYRPLSWTTLESACALVSRIHPRAPERRRRASRSARPSRGAGACRGTRSSRGRRRGDGRLGRGRFLPALALDAPAAVRRLCGGDRGPLRGLGARLGRRASRRRARQRGARARPAQTCDGTFGDYLEPRCLLRPSTAAPARLGHWPERGLLANAK